MKIKKLNTQEKTFGKSVNSYFDSLTAKAMKEEKASKDKKANQVDNFGQWHEFD